MRNAEPCYFFTSARMRIPLQIPHSVSSIPHFVLPIPRPHSALRISHPASRIANSTSRISDSAFGYGNSACGFRIGWHSIEFLKVKIILTFFLSACGMRTKNGNCGIRIVNAEPATHNEERGMQNPHRIVRNDQSAEESAVRNAEYARGDAEYRIPQKYNPAFRQQIFGMSNSCWF